MDPVDTAAFVVAFGTSSVDVDVDGDVDRLDYGFAATSFGRTSADALYVNALDEDDNGVVDIFDLMNLRDRLGTTLL